MTKGGEGLPHNVNYEGMYTIKATLYRIPMLYHWV